MRKRGQFERLLHSAIRTILAYSKLLSPPEFGLYAVALSVATLLALVLDGGLKTSIIKMEQELSVEQESSIAVLMLAVSAVLILALIALQHPLLSRHAEIKHDVRFIVLYVGIALFFYPFVTLPTAQLERKLEYGHIAWIESAGMILERGAPALFLIWTGAGIYSFVWALILSRIFRTTVLAGFHAIKLKVGRALDEDLAAVRAVAAAIGSKTPLRLDANGGVNELADLGQARHDVFRVALADHAAAEALAAVESGHAQGKIVLQIP